jgi:uncharacterized membrane protein (UPF0127 family)
MSLQNLILFYDDTSPKPIAFLRVLIVSTHDELVKGLSEHTALERNSGMLFVFDEPHTVKMQMRETKLPLDILFVDPTGRITHIDANAVPFSTDLYGPEIITAFVIEANAG